MDLHRSLAKTCVNEMEPPWINKSATMGLADSIETEQPVAMADVAEPRGPAVTGTSGPVEWERRIRPVTDMTGASGSRNGWNDAPVTFEVGSRSENVMPASGLAESGTGGPVENMKGRSNADGGAEMGMITGTGTGGPVVTETAFTAVAEVYAPISGMESQEGSDVGGLDPSEKNMKERTDLNDVEIMSEISDSGLCGDQTGNGGYVRDDCASGREVIRGRSDADQILKRSECSLDCSLDPESEEENEIMIGIVGSTAPWYLTGWTNDVEVEFMIDTGCQVTILATSVFDKMCDIHPEVKLGLKPCARRLVSADSSPLSVKGRVSLDIVFPGLRCDMWCVVADIGTDGSLGTEALQSYLPHQLDLRTGQLWADGRSTLQLHHQQRSPLSARCSLMTAVVLPQTVK